MTVGQIKTTMSFSELQEWVVYLSDDAGEPVDEEIDWSSPVDIANTFGI